MSMWRGEPNRLPSSFSEEAQMDCVTVIAGIISFAHPDWSPDRVGELAAPICEWSRKYDVDPVIVTSVIQHENNSWRERLVYRNRGGSRDYGLMQFNCPVERTHRWVRDRCRDRRRLLELRWNIEAGVKELSEKKNLCVRKRGAPPWKRRPAERDSCRFLWDVPSCRDCFDAYVLSVLTPEEELHARIARVRDGGSWWVRYYNYHSRLYGAKVLYVYGALARTVELYYRVISKRWYSRYNEACLRKMMICRRQRQQR